jgi:hypothetical protein
MNSVSIRCACGHSGSYVGFLLHPRSVGALPPNEWHCTSCGVHIRLVPIREYGARRNRIVVLKQPRKTA